MQQALKSHNGALLLQVKQERVNHLALQRSDRIAYYTQREAARSPVREVRTLRMRLSVRLSQSCAFPCAPCPQVGDTLTLIIDKMDSAKNLCPTFTTRFPKDVDESIVKNLLTLHLVGVIIHGQPDRRYMYAASQHLPGDTALNIQAICKALTHHLAGKGFRDKLYIQVDNASVRISPLTHPLHVSHLWPSASQDNKSRYMLGFLGFLVAEGYVLQVELSMLMVGHTHEGTLRSSLSLCAPLRLCAALCRYRPSFRRDFRRAQAAPCHQDHPGLLRRYQECVEKPGQPARGRHDQRDPGFQRLARPAHVRFTKSTYLVASNPCPGLTHALSVHRYSSQWKASEASTVGIKTARYFLISKRESDGAVVFWYSKRHSNSHTH